MKRNGDVEKKVVKCCLGPKKGMVDKTGEVGGEKILVVVLVVVEKCWWWWKNVGGGGKMLVVVEKGRWW